VVERPAKSGALFN